MAQDRDERPMGQRRLAWTLGLLLLAMAGYLSFWPVDIEPVAWVPSASPGLVGAFAHSRTFDEGGFRAHEFGPGPEDVAISPDGTLYSGLQDGRIMQLQPDRGRWNQGPAIGGSDRIRDRADRFGERPAAQARR
jgi:hypothetical protein